MTLCMDDMVLPTWDEMLLVMVPRSEFLSRRLEILWWGISVGAITSQSSSSAHMHHNMFQCITLALYENKQFNQKTSNFWWSKG